MTPDQVQTLFTRKDGSYLFSRWGRPIVPVVFGVDDATLSVVKCAIEAVVTLAGHKMAETDPELGANLMAFFLRDWAELPEVPNLDRLIPDLGPLCDRLMQAGANQYRAFRFDPDGSIKAAFVFLRMDAALSEMPAEVLALGDWITLSSSPHALSQRCCSNGAPRLSLPELNWCAMRRHCSKLATGSRAV